jgi:hypothetical protein
MSNGDGLTRNLCMGFYFIYNQKYPFPSFKKWIRLSLKQAW